MYVYLVSLSSVQHNLAKSSLSVTALGDKDQWLSSSSAWVISQRCNTNRSFTCTPKRRTYHVNIIQICHASVGNMTEWFSRGREPEGKPSSRGEAFHQVTHTGMAYLFYYTEQTPFVIVNKARSQMTGDSHIPR